jgi:ribosomal protein L7Ae-like RNA K-turn-binding protein
MARDAEVTRRLGGLLGLARKAGKLALGASAVEQLVERGERPVVVLATDAGQALRRRIDRLAPVRGKLADQISRSELAAACGRRDLAVVAVADRGFARGILQIGDAAGPAGAADTAGAAGVERGRAADDEDARRDGDDREGGGGPPRR